MDEATRLFLGILLTTSSFFAAIALGVAAIVLLCEPYGQTFDAATRHKRHVRSLYCGWCCVVCISTFVFLIEMSEQGAW